MGIDLYQTPVAALLVRLFSPHLAIELHSPHLRRLAARRSSGDRIDNTSAKITDRDIVLPGLKLQHAG